MTESESVLQEAQRLIHGDRNNKYGHPRDNFQNIADAWSAYKHVEFTPMDVGLMMVLLKVARLENGEYHRDSVTDIAGYAGTLERIFEEEKEAEPKKDQPVMSLTEEHRDRKWRDGNGWTYRHVSEARWEASRGRYNFSYHEPVGHPTWYGLPFAEVVT